ncbi:MAG: tyrosine-protein phosphatase [Thermoleophilaceae bacterium]
MTAWVDLHFHLLPGVDDGPATMGHSLALACAAVRDGTATVVATPHVRGDFHAEVDDLPARVREVRAALAAEAIPLRVLCGAELGHDMVARLTESELQTVAVGPPGARWLLLESPFAIDPAFHDAADELRERGFGVVLAHPERSAALLADDGAGLRREVDRGAALQVNASSLVGDHGPTARAAANLLVHAGVVGALASDAHSLARGPALKRGLRAAIRAGVPEPLARRATGLGPIRLVSGGLLRSRTPAYAS